MASQRGRVCFATPGAYPLLAGRQVSVGGGSELRAARFLKAMDATRHYDLSLIAFDYSMPRTVRVGAVEIIRDPVYAPQPTGALARASSRMLSIARCIEAHAPGETTAWEDANADVYVAFGVGDYSARLARWCLSRRRHFVLVAGSDSDFSADYRPDAAGHNPYGSRLGLCYEAVAHAGTIVVQTEAQRRLAAARFGRDARIIANPIELGEDDVQGVPARPDGHALWIGKSDQVKRPELLVDVARACPDIAFRMVLNPVDRTLFERIRAACPANVGIVEHAANEEVARLFAAAFCLVNTSVFEGFPNTFLEAGRHGVPVVTFQVDPDGVIAGCDAGCVAHGDKAALVEAVRRFDADRSAGRAAGARLREYVRTAHAAPNCYAQFDELLRTLLQDGSASRV